MGNAGAGQLGGDGVERTAVQVERSRCYARPMLR